MEQKLTLVLEQQKSERREYLALINATKDINLELYQMMKTAKNAENDKIGDVSSNETNTSHQKMNKVLNEKPSNTLQVPNNNNISNHINNSSNTNNCYQNERSKLLKVPKSPMRCKSPCKSPFTRKKFRKIPKKLIRPSQSLSIPTTDPDDGDNESDQDKEEVAIIWAHSVILNEFDRRCKLRTNNKEVAKRANDKLQAFHAFKRLQEEKEAKEKAKRMTIYKSLDSNKPDIDSTENINNNQNNQESTLDSEINNDNKVVENNIEAKEDDKKIEVVFLQDQIDTEKKKGHISMVSDIFNSNTEKGKMGEAQNILRRLDRVAEMKRQKEKEELERINEKKRVEEEKKRIQELKMLLKLKVGEEENNEAENGEEKDEEGK